MCLIHFSCLPKIRNGIYVSWRKSLEFRHLNLLSCHKQTLSPLFEFLVTVMTFHPLFTNSCNPPPAVRLKDLQRRGQLMTTSL